MKMLSPRVPYRWRHRWESAWHSVLRAVAAALAVVYCGWQVFWLTQGRIPPVLFLALTDLPAPTTGGTRSMVHLFAGRWRESLWENALALPIAVLFVLSVCWVLVQGLRSRRWRLPQGFLVAWLGTLGIAWAIKLVQHAFCPDL